MQDTGITTLPWHVWKRDLNCRIWSYGSDCNGGLVHQEKEAALIVKAVNNHDELVLLLQEAYDSGDDGNFLQWKIDTRALLAKIEGDTT